MGFAAEAAGRRQPERRVRHFPCEPTNANTLDPRTHQRKDVAGLVDPVIYMGERAANAGEHISPSEFRVRARTGLASLVLL